MNGNSVSLSSFAPKSLPPSKKSLGRAPSVATRIQSWCFFWLAGIVVGACFDIVLACNGEISFVALFVTIFAWLGAITEYRGIRVEASSICIPFRPLPHLPIFTFWTRRISLSEISSITVRPPLFGVETAVVTTLAGTVGMCIFPSASRAFGFSTSPKSWSPKLLFTAVVDPGAGGTGRSAQARRERARRLF